MFKIVFLTSSRKKYAHLKFLAQKLSIDITLFHELTYHATYTEPRIYNRKQLIEESVNSAIEQINKAGVFSNTYFLIEDTSVIIHALSSQDKEIPGVDIKYWMQENKFANINKLLKGKDRSVTVQSDMILFTKNKEFYYHVTGYSQGHITKKEYQIQTHLLYPWLDNQTFNKWFVPSGEKLPMSMLNIDTATQKDFRNNAFCKLYRLLNKDKKIAQNITSGIQQNVFPSRVIIITGHTCAGKTTIAQYIAKKYNFLHLEASDYMHLKFYDIHGITTKYHIGEFAKIALKEQPEIVAKEIINTLNAYPNINGIIISGFRSPKEVNYLTKHLNNNYIFSYFNINATLENRKQRFLSRNRDSTSFDQVSQNEIQMGVNKHQGVQIDNNSTFDNFYQNFERQIYIHKIKTTPNLLGRRFGALQSDIMLFLKSHYLSEQSQHFSTFDISKNINHHKDNISRFFNQKYSPLFEIKREGDVNKYKLSNTGYSFSCLYL